MMVFKLRSPLTAAVLAVLMVTLAGLALFRVDRVWAVRSEVVVSGSWGSDREQFGRGAGADGRPRGPQAIAVDSLGNLVVADSLNYRILIYGHDGALLEVLPLPSGAVPARTEDERAAIYGQIEPCLGWGEGFRPRPVIAAPARPWVEPVTVDGDKGKRAARPYVTDVDLSEGSWRVDAASGRIDPGSGPDIYLLAGWEGVALATDVTGTLKWTRDLSTSARFNEVRDPYDPQGPVTPASWAGFMLDLDTLPGGGILVAGYELLTDRLVYFVRALPQIEGEPEDLAVYELVRDGSVKVDEKLPIALEVESVTVGADGFVYVVAAAPPPPEQPAPSPGEPDGGPVVPGAGAFGVEALGASKATPFTREVWVFSPEGRSKGKLELQFETYTRHLRLIGVDLRGLLFARVGGAGNPGSLAVFDGGGLAALSIPLPDNTEIADAYLGGDGALYVSQATEEGYQIARHRIAGRSRLGFRWKKRP